MRFYHLIIGCIFIRPGIVLNWRILGRVIIPRARVMNFSGEGDPSVFSAKVLE